VKHSIILWSMVWLIASLMAAVPCFGWGPEGHRVIALIAERERLRLLLQDRQPHRDVEPVDHMFAVRMQILPDLPDVFAALGEKQPLLVFLRPLRFHQLPESPPWLRIIGLHETKALGGGTASYSCRRNATTLRPAITSKKPSLWAART
jgi:hypothetical protein